MIRERSFDSVTGRQLYSVLLPSAVPLSGFNLPSGGFACLIAWDAQGASAQTVSDFIEPLLRAGASYFVCWGPDCERVHDIIDETVSYPDHDFGVPRDSCIMTTWHASESLEEVLYFFLLLSQPSDHYVDLTRAALAISVGSPAWASEIAEALNHPQDFVKRVLSDAT